MSLTKYAPLVGEVEAVRAPGEGDRVAAAQLMAELMATEYVQGVNYRNEGDGIMVTFGGPIRSRAVFLPWDAWLVFIGDKAKVMDHEAFTSAYRMPEGNTYPTSDTDLDTNDDLERQ
jgi:hypothetical protein